MLAQDQVQAIVNLLSPENPNQTDAVFLVITVMAKHINQLKSKDKIIAKLEAQVEEAKSDLHDQRNNFLELEAKSKLPKAEPSEEPEV